MWDQSKRVFEIKLRPLLLTLLSLVCSRLSTKNLFLVFSPLSQFLSSFISSLFFSHTLRMNNLYESQALNPSSLIVTSPHWFVSITHTRLHHTDHCLMSNVISLKEKKKKVIRSLVLLCHITPHSAHFNQAQIVWLAFAAVFARSAGRTSLLFA